MRNAILVAAALMLSACGSQGETGYGPQADEMRSRAIAALHKDGYTNVVVTRLTDDSAFCPGIYNDDLYNFKGIVWEADSPNVGIVRDAAKQAGLPGVPSLKMQGYVCVDMAKNTTKIRVVE